MTTAVDAGLMFSSVNLKVSSDPREHSSRRRNGGPDD
jgi:hypothetical protein